MNAKKPVSPSHRPLVPCPKTPLALTIWDINRFLLRYLEALRAANGAKS